MGMGDEVRVKDLSIQSQYKILNFSFLKKRLIILIKTFYNGFIIWTPGI